jgi:methionine-rich copper-binding protein CopC
MTTHRHPQCNEPSTGLLGVEPGNPVGPLRRRDGATSAPWRAMASRPGRRVQAVVSSAVLALGIGVLSPATVHAHADLDSVSPAAGSVLQKAPRTVSVTFNEAVTVAKSSVELLDATGKVVARNGGAQTVQTVSVPVKSLAKGRYVLRWAVTSADGHPVVAASAFSVGATTKTARSASLSFAGVDGTTTGRLDGARVGSRTITLDGVSGEGTLELRHPLYKAPILWQLKRSGTNMTATGVLPAPGSWQVTMKVRTGPFDQLTRTATVKISS